MSFELRLRLPRGFGPCNDIRRIRLWRMKSCDFLVFILSLVMHIDSYQFGRIVIDGEEYGSDCFIIGDSVQPDWWRKSGHLLAVEDLDPIIKAGPEVLVIGCGSASEMKVPQQTLEFLRDENIRTEIFDTHKAVQRFNELSETGANVAAALHLTC